MTIETGDLVKATAKMNNQGLAAVQNVYHLYIANDNSATQANIRASIAQYVEDIYGNFDTYIPTTYNFVTISLYNVNKTISEPDVDWPTLTAGSATGDPLPEGTAVFA